MPRRSAATATRSHIFVALGWATLNSRRASARRSSKSVSASGSAGRLGGFGDRCPLGRDHGFTAPAGPSLRLLGRGAGRPAAAPPSATSASIVAATRALTASLPLRASKRAARSSISDVDPRRAAPRPASPGPPGPATVAVEPGGDAAAQQQRGAGQEFEVVQRLVGRVEQAAVLGEDLQPAFAVAGQHAELDVAAEGGAQLDVALQQTVAAQVVRACFVVAAQAQQRLEGRGQGAGGLVQARDLVLDGRPPQPQRREVVAAAPPATSPCARCSQARQSLIRSRSAASQRPKWSSAWSASPRCSAMRKRCAWTARMP